MGPTLLRCPNQLLQVLTNRRTTAQQIVPHPEGSAGGGNIGTTGERDAVKDVINFGCLVCCATKTNTLTH